MKEFSKEIINIDGVDYTLFLNRKGIVAWERITKARQRQNELKNKIKELNSNEELEIKSGDNPFEISGADDILEAEEQSKSYYKKLFWVMLYENHKLDYKDVEILFDKAVTEYGYESLIELSLQMLEDANINQSENNELKKLTALRPKKK